MMLMLAITALAVVMIPVAAQATETLIFTYDAKGAPRVKVVDVFFRLSPRLFWRHFRQLHRQRL